MKFLALLSLLCACTTYDIGESVVRVQSGGSSCTGFFVAPDRILTALHCVTPESDDIAVHYLTAGGDKAEVSAAIILTQPDPEGIAILAVNLDGPPVDWCDRGVYTGAAVEIWGWLPDDEPVSSRGMVLSHWLNKYVSTPDTSHGYSGGPLAHGDCVLAMHQGKTSTGSSYAEKPKLQRENTDNSNPVFLP